MSFGFSWTHLTFDANAFFVSEIEKSQIIKADISNLKRASEDYG